jgi:hypothetical protein
MDISNELSRILEKYTIKKDATGQSSKEAHKLIGNDVIIIKGAPGSGKSETAKKLSLHFKKGVRIEVDTIRSMVISVDWINWQEHLNMLKITANMTLDFLRYNFKPVIVIDTFFTNDKDKDYSEIKGFTDILYNSKNDLSVKIFSLYVQDNELKKRLDLRPDYLLKDFSLSKIINDVILNIKQDNETIVDSTNLTVEETVNKILNSL